MLAQLQLTAEDEAHAHPRADGEEGEVAGSPGDALPGLAERSQVDVVDERDLEAEALAQVAAEIDSLEAAVMGQMESPRLVDDPRDADDCTADPLPRAARGLDQRDADGLDCIERSVRIRAGQLHVLPDADLAAQITNCSASEARPEIQPEHERGVGNRLEEHRAETRAVRVVLGLADEPGLEQRLERQRDGRLRDPDPTRDLGAGDRRLGSQGLEHGTLVQVLEERRRRAGSWFSHHLVRNPNGKLPLSAGC